MSVAISERFGKCLERTWGKSYRHGLIPGFALENDFGGGQSGPGSLHVDAAGGGDR